MTTVEKMRMIKRLMDEVVGEITDVAEQVKDIDYNVWRMLVEEQAAYFKQMSKNYDSHAAGNRIETVDIQMKYAEKLIQNNK